MRMTVADSFKTSCFKNHTTVRVADNEDTQNQMVLYRVNVFTNINMDRISCTGNYCWCQMHVENSKVVDWKNKSYLSFVPDLSTLFWVM